ncbi:amino acid ABC transporter, periplasmic amino acid-binding protein [[Actinomadura] parvosata subsp. kistnae]|uniref:Amino acid ABC transporter substrate-binding protein n=1 Tax=[Actinomadura] parvosata subsp. kistnae TaxID=1909395 RepID=A0A1V0ACG5_9ACTN|nr:ABC transporter substrate-binding protein [Nonomuraea sp. ATCC 55076]AQZ67876.1 amino acid ABC transporter substrate-binding protein [Nonomuraea sp. ATCC 55076]SPL93783.1 amino acid ABC transporter, periplasmic amino acid-binding protein [Actinomadura parvosata subsp. kistnae]
MATRPLMLLALAVAVVGCAPVDNTAAISAAPTTSTACTKDQLKLLNPGKLTIGTDKPAFEPWFKNDDPSNGQGFESAVAFAVAGELGFDRSEVQWSTVKFDAAFAPGDKQFDFDINQVSITPERAEAVDFSKGYYTVKQAVVVSEKGKFAGAKSLAELKDAKIGVQVGTTSFNAVRDVIKPADDPDVFNDQIDVVTALKNDQVDAVVVDLPTAFYVTAVQVENSKIVGQFSSTGGTPEEFGMVMEKGSALKPCVDKAVDALKSKGELAKIEQQWLGSAAGAPELR